MISFKDFLTEARMAPLYHATSIAAGNKILEDNKLKSRRSGYKELPAVSLTRSLENAKHHGGFMHGTHSYMIFELDQQKLAQRYKIQPYNFWSQPQRGESRRDVARMDKKQMNDGGIGEVYNEFEERIVGRDIENVSKYITKVMTYGGSLETSSTVGYYPLVANHPLRWNLLKKEWVNK